MFFCQECEITVEFLIVIQSFKKDPWFTVIKARRDYRYTDGKPSHGRVWPLFPCFLLELACVPLFPKLLPNLFSAFLSLKWFMFPCSRRHVVFVHLFGPRFSFSLKPLGGLFWLFVSQTYPESSISISFFSEKVWSFKNARDALQKPTQTSLRNEGRNK